MKHERFAILDGLRGTAALVVLVFHIGQQHSLTILPYADLAVDFFYVLSGFVVALAYEARLRTGDMTISGFFGVRFKRLYPLVFLGTAAGIALAILAAVTKKTISMTEVLEAGALGLLVLPSFVIPRWSTAYPFNTASWSLTFEVFVNLVYGLIAKRLTDVWLLVLTLFSGIALIWLISVNHGIAGGNIQKGWAFGFIRVLYPFFVGVLIYRYRPAMRLRSFASIAVLIGLGAMLLAAWTDYVLASGVYVLILFPAFVFAGSALKACSQISTFCTFIGALSYPVYILQGPVLRVGAEVLRHEHVSGWGLIAFGVIEGAIVILIALLGLKVFDEPIQSMLKGRFAAPSALPLPQRP